MKKITMKTKKRNNRLIALLLAFVLSISMGTTAFAAEATPNSVTSENETSNEFQAPTTSVEAIAASARSASGYAAHYTDSLMSSFYTNVTGSSSTSGKVYLKAWDFPSTADVYVSLYRPDGSTAFANVKLPIGTEISKTFNNFQTGQYRLSYQVFGVDKGWIYNRFSS